MLFYAESVGVVTSGHVTKMPIEVLHGGNREFRVFLRKIVEIIKIFGSHPKKDVAVTETRLLSHKTRKSVKRCDLYRCARNKKVTGV